MSKTLEQLIQEIKAGALPAIVARELGVLEPPTYQELQTLWGHKGKNISTLTMLPDGRLVSADEEHIKLWNTATWECEATEYHSGGLVVFALTVLRDGRLAYAAEKYIHLWNPATGKREKTLCIYSRSGVDRGRIVTALTALPDGRLANWANKGEIKLWNVETGVCEALLVVEGHNNLISVLTALPDGRLASGSAGTIKLWNVETGACEATLEGHSDSIFALTVLLDGRLASGSKGTIKLWNVETGACEATLMEGNDWISALTVLPDGRLASGSAGRIKLWNVETGACEATLKDHSDQVSALTMLPDGRLASGSSDKTIKFWSVLPWLRPLSVAELILLFDALRQQGEALGWDASISARTLPLLDLRGMTLTPAAYEALKVLLLSPLRVQILQVEDCGLSPTQVQRLNALVSALPPLAVVPSHVTSTATGASTTTSTARGSATNRLPVLLPAKAKLQVPALSDNNYVEAMNSQMMSLSSAPTPTPITASSTLTTSEKHFQNSSQDIHADEAEVPPSLSMPEKRRHFAEVKSVLLDGKEIKQGKVIGQGGFGVVRKGTWHGYDVAIKQLHLQALSKATQDEFMKEVKMMLRLRHPSIVFLYGIIDTPKSIVMEFLPNGSLYDLLHSGRQMSWELRQQIGLDIAKGLSYLHSQRIHHRDLKSHNILLDRNNQAKLADFGLARAKTETATLTKVEVVGTLMWMAPELFDMEAEYTSKSDIYSYGIVLWEIAARQLPFSKAMGNRDLIVTWKLRGSKDPAPADTPAFFKEILDKCRALNPADRPDAQAVIEEFEAAEITNTAASDISLSSDSSSTAGAGYMLHSGKLGVGGRGSSEVGASSGGYAEHSGPTLFGRGRAAPSGTGIASGASAASSHRGRAESSSSSSAGYQMYSR